MITLSSQYYSAESHACVRLARDIGCSHIKVTGSSLGPWVLLMSKSVFVCVFEESLEEPPQLCFLQGQKLAKSEEIFLLFPAEMFFYKFTREKCPRSDGFDLLP